MRSVFDTNTVISALLFPRGRLAWLRSVWRERTLTPLVSSATAAELVRVLAYPKFKLSEADRNELLADYLPFAEVVSVSSDLLNLPRCRDERDQMFLELAAAGDAELLVTGDDDLLALAEEVGFAIVSPAQLRVRLTEE